MSYNKLSSFGEYIRDLRESNNISLRKVADLIGIDPSLLSKIERNERHPTKEIINKISKLFKQNEEKLIRIYVSDIIAYRIIEEEVGIDTLKVAEEKVNYLKSKN